MPAPRHHQSPADVAAGLARVALLASRLAERVVAPLTVGQYLALQAADQGELAAADLARATGVSPAAVSQLLAGLEDAGHVSRSRAPDDKRRQVVVLTAAGRRALRSAEARVSAPLAELVAQLPPPEVAALGRALPSLAALLTGSPPPRHPPHPPRGPRKP